MSFFPEVKRKLHEVQKKVTETDRNIISSSSLEMKRQQSADVQSCPSHSHTDGPKMTLGPIRTVNNNKRNANSWCLNEGIGPDLKKRSKHDLSLEVRCKTMM
ncbi:hypothetical protein ATANTOWER_008008 [Ataeniobius toweri]|uniref:Uncharacterized protein n=1 Tax=Ataeniobius toweri TaxID=208326 RepID=A0ABU7AWS6_9TELE|nr:hypothetical protein [Ataeniobius toweri]